ncbi:Glycosyl hydrolases family 16 [Mesobacillus persicus]|uniref:licheninase n=1 Tax=Mesobacillus persicus TaxID=930146 RepID=A0A1H8CIE5_9BACI|nr:glycoside hydrolase family 16 protein [Mesobacillus persicus]SEM94048.1 Glycosyl hydrolases family 16 [Mesobacillus persicus]
MGKRLRVFSIVVMSIIALTGVIACSPSGTDMTNEERGVSLKETHDKPTPQVEQDTTKITADLPVQTKVTTPEGWQLAWEDNFDGIGVDSNKWNIVDWAAEKNEELQYYSPNNVKVENGLLKLIAKKEQFGGRDYTSGAVHTKSKYSFLYGKVEMRAKLPTGQGMFPAFWMMTNKEDTWLPEIDILEMLGHKPKEIWMVLHWLDENQSLRSVSDNFIGPDFSESFHTFGIEWTPKSIVWFIDGEEKFRVQKNIPSEEMYLYLNTAVGGVWPGSPDQTTQFPTFYEIDYVRVYQKNGGN